MKTLFENEDMLHVFRTEKLMRRPIAGGYGRKFIARDFDADVLDKIGEYFKKNYGFYQDELKSGDWSYVDIIPGTCREVMARMVNTKKPRIELYPCFNYPIDYIGYLNPSEIQTCLPLNWQTGAEVLTDIFGYEYKHVSKEYRLEHYLDEFTNCLQSIMPFDYDAFNARKAGKFFTYHGFYNFVDESGVDPQAYQVRIWDEALQALQEETDKRLEL